MPAEVFEAANHPGCACHRDPHPLELKEHRIRERREAFDGVGQRGRKRRTINVQPVSEGRGNGLRHRFSAETLAQRARRTPRHARVLSGRPDCDSPSSSDRAMSSPSRSGAILGTEARYDHWS